ncbi:MAG: hypothetical protein QM784_37980 [Polyangiaceae bacterium]
MGRGFGKTDFGRKVLLLAVLAVLTSLLLTTFSLLHQRFQLAHTPHDLHLKVPSPLPPNPYSAASKVMTYASFLVPLVAAVVLSARYFRDSQGSSGLRLLKAMGLTATSVPLMALQYLPWGIHEVLRSPEILHTDDVDFLMAWIALYAAVLLPLSLSCNAVLWLTERFRAAPSS